MPIVAITEDHIETECAACGKTREVKLADLTVGLAREDQVDGNLVRLPPCPACGACEFLIRAPDKEPEHPSPGSFGHLHRLLVEVLHAQLVQAGRLVPRLDPATLLTRAPSEALLRQWFSEGLRLAAEVRPEEAARPAP